MALQLPDWTSIGIQNPNPGDNRPTYSGQNPEAAAVGTLGTGLQTLGHGAQILASEQQRQANMVNGSLALAQLHTDTGKTLLDIEAARDPAKIDQLYSQLNDHLENASKIITDPGFRNLWMARHSVDVANAQLTAVKQQRKVYADRFIAGADSQLGSLLQQSQQTTDPAQREQFKQDIGRVISSLADAGVVPDTKAQQLAQYYKEAAVTGHAHWLDATGDPTAALAYTLDNKNEIPGKDLDQLVTHLQPRASMQVGRSEGAAAMGGGGAAAPSGPAPTGPLNPAFVTSEAQRQGVDPVLAHTMFDIESTYGANTGNDISPSNTGAAQMAPANAPGGMNDTMENQVKLGIGSLAKRETDLRARLGRSPAPWEVYAAHQQGASGYAQLAANPEKLAVDVRPAVNISNNVPKGTDVKNLTAGQFLNDLHQMYDRHAAKFANLASAAPSGDQVTPPGTSVALAAGTTPPPAATQPIPTVTPVSPAPGMAQISEAQTNLATNYGNALAGFGNNPKLTNNPMAMDAAVHEAERLYLAHKMVLDGQAKAISEKRNLTADAYVQEMMRGPITPGIIDRIAGDNTLDLGTRENLWRIYSQHTGSLAENDLAKYGPTFYRNYQRIAADNDDPNRIHDPSQIYALAVPHPDGTQDLTLAGAEKLTSILRGRTAPEKVGDHKLQEGALAYAKHQLSLEADYGVFKVRDPEGEDAFNVGFLPAFMNYWESGLAAGKSAHDLVDRKQIDTLIAPFKRSAAEIARVRMLAGTDEGRAAAPAVKSGPIPAAVAYLKQNPGSRGYFDQAYGTPENPTPSVQILGAPAAPAPPIATPAVAPTGP